MADDIEKQRLDIEAAKIKNDFEIKKEELRLRDKELEGAQLRASKEGKGLTAPVASALAAAATLVGGVLGAGITGYFSSHASLGVESKKAEAAINLKSLKFQTGLVIKAIETKDQSQAVATLKFFAKAGLISTFKDDVLALTEKNEGREVPAIGPGQFDYEPLDAPVRNLGQFVAKLERKGNVFCTGVALPQKMVLTANYCLGSDATKVDLADLTVSFGSGPGVSFKVTRVVELNKETGIGIVEFAAGEDQSYPRYRADAVRFRDPRAGENLIVLSYPDLKSLMVSRRNCVVTDPARGVDFGHQGADAIMSASNLFTYRCGVPMGAGGAPIFGSDYSLIGIVYAGASQQEWGKRAQPMVIHSATLKQMFAAAPAR